MAKKMIKKKKVKLVSLLLLLLIVAVFFFVIYFYMKTNIKNVIINGTSYLSDDYVMELAGIKDYPSFCLTSSKKMKKELLKSPYIKDVKIKKEFYNVINIKVEEKKALFINERTNKVVFNSKDEVNNDEKITLFRIPRLLNYVPDKKYQKLISSMEEINDSILGKMSEMEYNPNEFDKDRFLIYMDDGNTVYLTLTKFKAINYYNEVLPQLEGKKGILYLDSGNHFKIME